MFFFWSSPSPTDAADAETASTTANNNTAASAMSIDDNSTMDRSSVRLNSTMHDDSLQQDPNLSVLSVNRCPMEVRQVTIKKTTDSAELLCDVKFKDASRQMVAFRALDAFLNGDGVRGAVRELNIVDVQIDESFIVKMAEVKKERLIGMNLRLVNVDFVGLVAPSFRTLFNNVLLPRNLEFHDVSLPFHVSTNSLFGLIAVQISNSLVLSPSVHIVMDPMYPIDHIDPDTLLNYLHQGNANVVRSISIVDKHLELGVKAFIKYVVKLFMKDRMLPCYEMSIMCSGNYDKKLMPMMQCVRNQKTGQWLKLDAADKSLYAEYPHYLPFFVLKLKREALSDH